MELYMLKDDLIDRLKRLDEDASFMYDSDGKFQCVIIGGSALILMGYITRATHDIDVIKTDKELYKLFEKYDFNTNAISYEPNFPYYYENRFKKVLIDTIKIDYYTASLEDIVISKLCSPRPKDEKDIENESILSSIDWEKLELLANEEKLSALNENNYQDFKFRYEEYVKRFGK